MCEAILTTRDASALATPRTAPAARTHAPALTTLTALPVISAPSLGERVRAGSLLPPELESKGPGDTFLGRGWTAWARESSDGRHGRGSTRAADPRPSAV